jgi:hypothetical protein
MTRYLLALIAALGTASDQAAALERNYTIRGTGYVDGGGRAGRMDLSEVRMTLHDNGDFAATLFARGERVIVRGNWNRPGNGNVERLLIESVRGVSAEGSGTIQYRRDGDPDPERLVLEGRTRNGTFHAVIDDTRLRNVDRDPGAWDRGGWDPDGRARPGSSNRLRYDIDATTYGDGTVRMSGVRGGDFSTVRARLGTNRAVRIDIDRSTRGTIHGEIQDVRGDRITVRVTDMFGYNASGDLVVLLRGSNEVARINGSGTSRNGSWQLDFDGNGRRDDGRWDDDPWGNGGWGGVDGRTERGSGQLRQDVGPAIAFDRMRVSLQNDREAVIVLDGRRDPVRLTGRWSTGRDGDVVIQLQRVNEMRASGRLELSRTGSRVTSLSGNGRTERGRFEVWFSR